MQKRLRRQAFFLIALKNFGDFAVKSLYFPAKCITIFPLNSLRKEQKNMSEETVRIQDDLYEAVEAWKEGRLE